jgi:hypothetical protein
VSLALFVWTERPDNWWGCRGVSVTASEGCGGSQCMGFIMVPVWSVLQKVSEDPAIPTEVRS